jgi:serine/threonine-protein kinase
MPDDISGQRSEVPSGLNAVLRKALAKSPGDRFATAGDFGQALRALLPKSESEVRAGLATLLKNDFGLRMAEMLGIESLAERDEAWRLLSHPPQRRTSSIEFPDESSRPRLRGEETKDRRAAEASVSIAPTRVERAPRTLSDIDLDSVLEPNFETLSKGAAARLASAQHAGAEGITAVDPALGAATDGTPVAAGRRLLASWQGAALGLVFVVSMAAVGLAMSLGGVRTPAVVPRFRVVASPQLVVPPAPEQEPATTPASAAPVAAVGASRSAPDAAPVAPEPVALLKPRKDRSAVRIGKRGTPDAVALTQAFRGQQPKIEACFAAYSKDLVGQPAIQVEFDLDGAGRLKRAQVLPKAFGSTALGGCIERVSRTTKFPNQGQTVSFTIPVHASRTSER